MSLSYASMVRIFAFSDLQLRQNMGTHIQPFSGLCFFLSIPPLAAPVVVIHILSLRDNLVFSNINP